MKLSSLASSIASNIPFFGSNQKIESKQKIDTTSVCNRSTEELNVELTKLYDMAFNYLDPEQFEPLNKQVLDALDKFEGRKFALGSIVEGTYEKDVVIEVEEDGVIKKKVVGKNTVTKELTESEMKNFQGKMTTTYFPVEVYTLVDYEDKGTDEKFKKMLQKNIQSIKSCLDNLNINTNTFNEITPMESERSDESVNLEIYKARNDGKEEESGEEFEEITNKTLQKSQVYDNREAFKVLFKEDYESNSLPDETVIDDEGASFTTTSSNPSKIQSDESVASEVGGAATSVQSEKRAESEETTSTCTEDTKNSEEIKKMKLEEKQSNREEKLGLKFKELDDQVKPLLNESALKSYQAKKDDIFQAQNEGKITYPGMLDSLYRVAKHEKKHVDSEKSAVISEKTFTLPKKQSFTEKLVNFFHKA